ncbi:MAG TPA: hypothetical protein VK287_03120 [Gaiellaceae bacterium]|nr:hypothetical protein [Gaiellaceae bacterium]
MPVSRVRAQAGPHRVAEDVSDCGLEMPFVAEDEGREALLEEVPLSDRAGD